MGQEAKLTPLGKIAILLFLTGCLFGAFYLIFRGKGATATPSAAQPGTVAAKASPDGTDTGGPKVEIGIAYGTEKENWLRYAVRAFADTPEGKSIKINLIPMGSLEGALGRLERPGQAHPRLVAGQLAVQGHLCAGLADQPRGQ